MNINVSHVIETDLLSGIFNEYNMGLEVVLFARSHVLDDCDNNLIKYMVELEKLKNLKGISLHGPFMDLSPASRDNKIKEITRYRFEAAYKVAEKLNSKRIIFHSGFVPKTYPLTEWMDNAKAFWSDFLIGKLNNMEIHLENVYEDDYNLISQLVDHIDNPNFSVCLDVGHVNANSSKPLDYWIKGLGNKIRHIHMHNNDGIRDNHFGLLKGTIDINKAIKTIRQVIPYASWTLEILSYEELKESLEYLKKEFNMFF